MNKLIHIPEGLRDIYGKELDDRRYVYTRVHEEIRSHGYIDIKTPSFEYFDLFSKKAGANDLSELYKFSDKDNNTLVLRPDFTPGVARACAKYFVPGTLPVRLTYLGNVFTNHEHFRGKLKELSQLGAELIGEPSLAADAEIVALNAGCLDKSGLKDYRIILGHTDFILGILEELSLSEEACDQLIARITRKNRVAVDELLESCDVQPEYKELISSLTTMIGGADILSAAREKVHNEKSIKALDRLEDLYRLLEAYDATGRISFDLGMLSSFRYYTGIIFKAYAHGAGEPVSKGGRYDSLIEKFGKKAAAVGFVINMDLLMDALYAQGSVFDTTFRLTILVYRPDQLREAIAIANGKRAGGGIVELVPYGGSDDPKDYVRNNMEDIVEQVCFINDGQLVAKNVIEDRGSDAGKE